MSARYWSENHAQNMTSKSWESCYIDVDHNSFYFLELILRLRRYIGSILLAIKT